MAVDLFLDRLPASHFPPNVTARRGDALALDEPDGGVRGGARGAALSPPRRQLARATRSTTSGGRSPRPAASSGPGGRLVVAESCVPALVLRLREGDVQAALGARADPLCSAGTRRCSSFRSPSCRSWSASARDRAGLPHPDGAVADAVRAALAGGADPGARSDDGRAQAPADGSGRSERTASPKARARPAAARSRRPRRTTGLAGRAGRGDRPRRRVRLAVPPALKGLYPSPGPRRLREWRVLVEPEPLEDVRSMLALATPVPPRGRRRPVGARSRAGRSRLRSSSRPGRLRGLLIWARCLANLDERLPA